VVSARDRRHDGVAFFIGLTVWQRTGRGAVRHGGLDKFAAVHPAGAQGEPCALIQSVVAEDRSNAA